MCQQWVSSWLLRNCSPQWAGGTAGGAGPGSTAEEERLCRFKEVHQMQAADEASHCLVLH